MDFNKNILNLDSPREADRICQFILNYVRDMHKDGIVIGLSGGIDSAVAAALSVKAVGPEKVLGLILPERDSNPVSAEYARRHAVDLGIRTQTVDLKPVLEAFGTYSKRDEVIRALVPDYNPQSKIKITLPGDLLEKDALNFFTLTVQNPAGEVKKVRLNKEVLNGIVAATNTKQRMRMLTLYYYAEKYNYLECGTTNKSEAVQGFFVKYGDGGVDIEPLAHLYKVQVYQLAEYLQVIPEIIQRDPSPDTYSFPVSDEEFYFRIEREKLDLLLYAWEYKVDIQQVCQVMQLEETQVKRAFRDFNSKFNATRHTRRMPPELD